MRADGGIAIPVPTSNDFEYNHRSWPMYAAAVKEAGGLPVKVELDWTPGELARVMQSCRGILLPGSPADVDPALYGQERIPACAPADLARQEIDRLLLEEAYRSGKPVLGICYGVQSLNVWCGGTLVQDLPSALVNHAAGSSVAVAHSATITGGSNLLGLVPANERIRSGEEVRLQINSSHHQAIEQPGAGLRVVAVSTQDGVMEAVEGCSGPDQPAFVLGVQWHPERSVGISETSRAIFAALLRAAGTWEQRHLAAEAR